MMILKIFVFFCVAIFVKANYQEAPYAQWAHDHLVWINGRQQNQTLILKLVSDYQQRGIKVGAVNIDSGWSTRYSNFEWNYKKFPNPQNIIEFFHKQNIKVMLWVTPVINNDSELYDYGVKNNYFLNGEKLVKWWHGYGGTIDYFNPKAVQWWHSLMDKVLDLGVDGWKCDGTDPLIFLLRPWPYSPFRKRYIGLHQYGHAYYGDTYNYTKSKNPQALIMSRPSDFYNFTSWNYSPKYVMFSGWVGDQDSSAAGFKSAMSGVLLSAWNNYLNFGYDIGGYRGQNISKSIFLRQVQVGALLPWMENGGNGKHQPWDFDEETVQIYKKFVDIHYELKPFFLTTATNAYKKKKSTIKPLMKKRPAAMMANMKTFGYTIGTKLLVFPIFEENGFATLVFPKGENWIYYFDHKIFFQGGTETYRTFEANETPFFMRNNSIICLQSKILLVGLREGGYKETFIYGKYSEDLQVKLVKDELTIKIDRFYKSEEEALKLTDTEREIQLIGLQVDGKEEKKNTFYHELNSGEKTIKIKRIN